MEMPSPLGEDGFGITTGVQDGKEPDFRRTDDVEQRVREAVKIQAAHVGEAGGIILCVAWEIADMNDEIVFEFPAQAGGLLFIPVEGRLQVTVDQRVFFEREYRRIRGTSVLRRLL